MRYALVTGGSRGIGRACSLRLAESGYHVLINYRNNDAAAAAVRDEIMSRGGTADLLKFDVADALQVETILASWLQGDTDRTPEVLVNNAGVQTGSLFAFMEVEDWTRQVHTNLDSFFYVTRRVLAGMIYRKYGRIINISSVAGLRGMAGNSAYAASKAGLAGAAKSLALEVARWNITVNNIAPGFIQTDMTGDLKNEDIEKAIPAGRIGLPEEVASAVAFLASADASYITGQTISVCGGLHM